MLAINQRIKKRIKLVLNALPYGIGVKFVIPIVKWILTVFVYRTPIRSLQRKRYAKNEAQRINLAIQNDVTSATIVYDNFVSPPTYGDYLYVILVARYFIAHGIMTNFIITDSEYRQDWLTLTEIERERFVNQQMELAVALLDPNFVKIKKISWKSTAQILVKNPSSFILFSKNINERVHIYGHCFNLLNQLLYGKKCSLVDRVLFSYNENFHNLNVEQINRPYITWGCRWSEKWGLERNLLDEEFLNIYLKLRKRFPYHEVLIVSDEIGCKHFFNLARSHGHNVLVSKDYSSSFLGDGGLILKSDFFYQFRGGGISVFALNSKTPYECSQPLMNENMWTKTKLTSFQTASQEFYSGIY
jgi:hypothetical protein